MSPFFSIIIPTYNVEDLLKVSVQSVLSQDFNNYEVIIMDGGSADKTVEIAKTFAKENPRIRVFSEKDHGIYDAMNKSIQCAKGDYLFFLGSDDTFYNHQVFTHIHESLTNKPVDVLYGDVYSTRFNGVRGGEFDTEKLYYKNICHQSVFFKKAVFSITGLFSLKYKALSDYEHNIKWFFNHQISKRYEKITIANYADGGFSSLNEDTLFLKDKKKLFIKYAGKNISYKLFFKMYFPKLIAKLK